MEIGYVKEFLVLSAVCNYEEAADILYISQSSLYKHIKALEADIGVELFSRSGKRIVFYAYGELFVPYAKKLEETDEMFRRSLHNSNTPQDLQVRVFSEVPMIDMVMEFTRKYPMYQCDSFGGFYGMSGSRSLGTGEADVCFISEDVNELDDSFEKIPFDRIPLSLIVYKGHRLEKRKIVELNELEHERFITYMSMPESDNIYHNVFQEAHFHPKIVLTATNGDSINSMVAQKLGIALLFQKTFEKPNEGTVVINLKNEIAMKIYMCYRKNCTFPEAVEAFIEFAKKKRRWYDS